MTELSTELVRLADAAKGDFHDAREMCAAIQALYQGLTDNLPAIIAAIKAAKTPLADVAGLVERFIRYAEILEESETRQRGRKATNTWAVGFREAADLITAQARQIASLKAELTGHDLIPEGNHAKVLAKLAERDARLASYRRAMERAAQLIERNLYHQREKVEDAPRILRGALAPSALASSRQGAKAQSPDEAALVEELAREAYARMPMKAISQALAERAGVELRAPIPYDRLIEIGGNHNGLLCIIRSILPSIQRREAAAHAAGVASTFDQRARDLTDAHAAGRAERQAELVAWLREGGEEGAKWDDGAFFADAIDRGQDKAADEAHDRAAEAIYAPGPVQPVARFRVETPPAKAGPGPADLRAFAPGHSPFHPEPVEGRETTSAQASWQDPAIFHDTEGRN